jgi:hypothetical protein
MNEMLHGVFGMFGYVTDHCDNVRDVFMLSNSRISMFESQKLLAGRKVKVGDVIVLPTGERLHNYSYGR